MATDLGKQPQTFSLRALPAGSTSTFIYQFSKKLKAKKFVISEHSPGKTEPKLHQSQGEAKHLIPLENPVSLWVEAEEDKALPHQYYNFQPTKGKKKQK